MSEGVKRGSMSEDVYERLRTLIMEGVYQPNDRLPHPQIMRMLNAGRTPVREALSRLQSEGLVVISPNRGASVAPVRPESLEEVHILRLLIEPPLLEAGLPLIRSKQLKQLRVLLGTMEAASSEPAAFVRAHRLFHVALRAEYTSPVIDEVVMRTHALINHHQEHMLPRQADPEDFIRLDRETLSAIDERDGRRARQTLEFHLLDAAISLLLGENPEDRLTRLGPVAHSVGMRLQIPPEGPLVRPLDMSWVDPSPGIPALVTANLKYLPT